MKTDVVEFVFEYPRKEHCPQSLYDDQVKYFVECIEKKRTLVPSGLEGLMNIKVVDAAYESSRTGKVVKVQ